ncbi:DNA repair protein RecO C-terminal domain-containing protein, partial [Candidatus Falkowbacteria bacterium]|nr:DNA repair protein RecO C-terminal domain-containing protein [Candidatus Falkowbacteria bacterium]
DVDFESLVHIFGVKLLDLLGYRPELTRCTQCLRGIIAPHAVIDVRAGGLICRECAPQKLPEYAHTISDAAIKYLLLALDEHFETLKNYRFGTIELSEFKKIARQLLEFQLHKPLTALDAFKGL